MSELTVAFAAANSVVTSALEGRPSFSEEHAHALPPSTKRQEDADPVVPGIEFWDLEEQSTERGRSPPHGAVLVVEVIGFEPTTSSLRSKTALVRT